MRILFVMPRSGKMADLETEVLAGFAMNRHLHSHHLGRAYN